MKTNPFVLSPAIPDEYFCDRQTESASLIKSFKNQENVVLISPRRVGKTGLIYHCFNQPEIHDNFITVSIDIPIDINKEENKEVNTHEKVDLSGINVLVVEDNEINWEVISTLLDMHGISSERAENGKVAVDLVSNKDNENRYDLIFMDIQMPVMNGLDATREIRKLGNNIPIIAMTADAFSENITECLNAGMNGHIAKPIDINIVLNEIKKIKSK